MQQRRKQESTWGLWLAVVAFGLLLNPLMLTGPLFMLQVYDRVLPSGSVPTLSVLFALVAFLYAMMALLDAARARLLLRIGARLQAGLERRVMTARRLALSRDPPDPRAQGALDDLDTVQHALASSAMLALFDTPWAFAFLALLFVFHPAMGALALAAGAFLIALGGWSRWRQHIWHTRARVAHRETDALAQSLSDEAEMIAALGMGPSLETAWSVRRDRFRADALQAADRQAFDAAMARAFRLFMQSAVLALGGWLVLQGQLSEGLIFAASILMGRALAPVEQVSANWAQLRAARVGWHRLHAFLAATPPPGPVSALPADDVLGIQGLVVAPPGRGPLLKIERLSIAPGRALGVIGPCGAGKTLLARALLGLVPLAAGVVRLGSGGATARRVGYLPQRQILFEGTLAENIAGFHADADPIEIERVARLAGLHDQVMRFPRGYETQIDRHGTGLPRGVVQRIALARALHATPSLVILDEPNAHMDAAGMSALNAAIRSLKSAGSIVVVLSHRAAGIAECDDLLVLDAGTPAAYGPRDRVLRDVVRNHTALVAAETREAAG